MKEVQLFAGDTLVARKVSFPFQLRYWPQASDVGNAVVLKAVAIDAAGNTGEATRTVNVVASEAVVEAPLPAPGSRASIAGEPATGRTLT